MIKVNKTHTFYTTLLFEDMDEMSLHNLLKVSLHFSAKHLVISAAQAKI